MSDSDDLAADALASELLPRSLAEDSNRVPPPAQLKSQLVRHVINEMIGPFAGNLAQIIMQFGKVSLKQIVITYRENNEEVNVADVKQTLQTMIQKCVVKAERNGAFDEEEEMIYSVEQSEVEGILRFPKYVMMLQKRDGLWFDAAGVVETFAEFGRFSRASAVELTLKREKELGGSAGDESRIRINKAFEELYQAGYVEKLNLSEFEEQSKSSHGVKLEAVEREIFKVSHSRFALEFRNLFIQEFVCGKIDGTAARIVQLMLEPTFGPKPESMLKNESKNCFTEISLYEVLAKAKISITRQSLRGYLDEMINDSIPILKYDHGSSKGDVFYVDVPTLIAEAKCRRAQSIIRAKFDNFTARIFRLLATSRFQEEKQICEKSLLPEKKVREILLRLSAENFVHMQEIPKSADRNPRRTFFLWSTNLSQVYSSLLGAFMMTWLNLKSRLSSEIEKDHVLLSKAKKFPSRSAEHFSEAELAKLSIHEKMTDRLENALLKLDDSIMLFSIY